jgi:hypothetical protein
MRETVQTTIGDTTYHITKLGTKDSRRIGRRLARIFGVSAEAEQKAAKFFEVLSDDEFDFLCDTFAKVTMISPADSPLNAATGAPEKMWALTAKMDDHFSGHLGLMMQWLKACVEANFGNFLEELGPELKAYMEALATPEPPMMTIGAPTGSFGASSVRASAASSK